MKQEIQDIIDKFTDVVKNIIMFRGWIVDIKILECHINAQDAEIAKQNKMLELMADELVCYKYLGCTDIEEVVDYFTRCVEEDK